MGAAATDRLDCLLVVTDEDLQARLKEVFEAWHLHSQRVDAPAAMERVGRGLCRVVVVERFPGLRLYLGRLRAAGAVPIVLGQPGADVPPEVECVVRPSALVASVFRAQGRLQGLEGGGAVRISQLAQVIAEQFALPELVKVAMAKTRELCEADGASLLLIDPSTGGLAFDTVDGEGSGKIERVQLPRGRGVAGKVAVEARPRLVEDAQTCPDFDGSADRQSGFTTGSIVAAPLVLSGDVLGVLMAVRSTSAPPFSPVHLERLVQLTPHVAIAVHNAQITTALRASQQQVLEANVDLEKKVVERTQQISRAKKEWERTFDAIDSPIALMDGYRIRRTNHAYARKVGREVRELPGETCHKVFAQRDTPCPGCPIVNGRGKPLAAEIETPDAASGRSSYFRVHGYWLSDDADGSSVVVTYHDVTQAHVLEDKLRESERLAAVGQLASGAAHEINNPLGFVTSNLRSLRGLLDELRSPLNTFFDLMLLAKEKRFDEITELLSTRDEPDSHSLDDGIEMIDESLDGARRVGDIVKGLRELSRLEIGKREPANVNASVTRVVRAELGDAANVVLQLDAQRMADIPPLQLDQALGHILRNAKQATSRKETISVRTFHLNELVYVQVRDEGVGIPKENLRRVFEPFFTTRGVGKGIGLGLTAAYGIVRRVGGDIEAHSEGPGKGATFTVRLPRAEHAAMTDAA
jgi:two-component system NtrC family sensor kinase